ncbi:MAG: hypothetical protein M3023_00725 [Pseudomonadota bacterium]|nr:hypothetical protein [Pseudomonadota bacterium]
MRLAISVRTAPLAAADPLAPQWARAMRPSATRGPFVNALGERFWIDTFAITRLVTIEAQTGAPNVTRILARVPMSRRPAVALRRRLSAGSVWLPARVLVPGRPDNEFVGVRIRGGTIRLDGIANAADATITLGGAWRLDLQLQLDAPANPGPAAGPGADAAEASITLPASVALKLDHTGAMTIDVAAASATAYDTSFDLERSADAPFYDALSSMVVVPCAASRADFPFATVRSNTVEIAGSPRIARSGWALAVAVTSPTALGDAAGAGALWLAFHTPLQLRWSGLPQLVASPVSALALAPGSIMLWATLNAAEVTQRLRLWDETDVDPPRQSTIEVVSAAGSVVLHASAPGAETVVYSGKAVGHLDRPLQVDGHRVGLRMPAAWYVVIELPAGTTAGVVAADPAAYDAPHIAFALENALLKVRPPAWLVVGGALANDQLANGLLLLRFPLRALTPTLPDPYAANFDFNRRRDTDQGWMTARVAWPDSADPVLDFTVETGASPLLPVPNAVGVDRGAMLAARAPPPLVLVDVSSNADQFGVAIPQAAPSLRVQGLAVVAEADHVAVVTLPPISWEPMLTKAPLPGTDVPLPPPPHDGGIAYLTAEAKDVAPVVPIALVSTYHDAINAHRHFSARLPLPFGIVAQVETRREGHAGRDSRFLPSGGRLFLNQPVFDATLEGGRQLALLAPPNKQPGIKRDPTLPGYTEFPDDNYARGVLSDNLHKRFGGDFGSATSNGIPVRRYELSGYGASLMTDWRDPQAVGPAIIEARFDVLVGRTSHEVIQMQSVLYPWFIRVVRTITIDRQAGGWILREDSGWVAASDGKFEYRGDPPAVPAAFKDAIHPGMVDALVNVRHIQLAAMQFDIPGRSGGTPTTWQSVTFDADVQFTTAATGARLKVAGGAENNRTPSSAITGWIQIDGPMYKDADGVDRVRPADDKQVFDLLAFTGVAKAPIACSLSMGGTDAEPGLALRAVRVEAGCDDAPNAPQLVAAVRGSPVLPRDGAWSIARRAAAEPAPTALDAAYPMPVVAPNAKLAGNGRWHLADAADITRLADGASPTLRYGFVQMLGAQKVFFDRPRVGNDPKPVTLPAPPQLADMGALLNAASIFPGLGDVFHFQTTKALAVNGGSIDYTEVFTIGAAGSIKEALLVDLGGADALRVLIRYCDESTPEQPTVATVTVKPTAATRWQLSLARVCFCVEFRGKPLIGIFASVEADEHKAPTVVDLKVRYESILRLLQTIFTNVEQVARFLPGGVGAGLKIGFSQGRLTVRNNFALPALPLGPGQITDVAAEMGFDVALAPFDLRFTAGLGSSEKPFRWVVSPLAGTGAVVVGVGSKGLDLLVQGGLGVGLCIDLGIAAGSASIAIAMEMITGPDPFELRAILSGRASVDVLRGLASATITLAAGLGIIPPPELEHPPFFPPQLIPIPNEIPSLTIGLIASVSAGIHLSVCWVIDVDWDGYWQFRQDIKTPAIPIPI